MCDGLKPPPSLPGAGLAPAVIAVAQENATPVAPSAGRLTTLLASEKPLPTVTFAVTPEAVALCFLHGVGPSCNGPLLYVKSGANVRGGCVRIGLHLSARFPNLLAITPICSRVATRQRGRTSRPFRSQNSV